MHIHCPHCRSPIEVVEDQELRDVTCHSCGSSFNLLPDETVTRTAVEQKRVSAAGPGTNEQSGHYLGFDTKMPYLGRMKNNWQPLETCDMSHLECQAYGIRFASRSRAGECESGSTACTRRSTETQCYASKLPTRPIPFEIGQWAAARTARPCRSTTSSKVNPER